MDNEKVEKKIFSNEIFPPLNIDKESKENNYEVKSEIKNEVESESKMELKEENNIVVENINEQSKQSPNTNLCLKCGYQLEKSQKFCPKCGTPKGATNNKICTNCGNVLEQGEKFCSKCGNKAKFDIQNDFNNMFESIQKKPVKKNTKIKIGIIALLIIVVLSLCINILPKLMISTTELLKEGKYAEAYEKAKGDEKEEILAENLIAYLSNQASEGLKDPSSFKLRNAWYDKNNQEIVLYINGNNSYGASVTAYWYYTIDDDSNKYELYVSLSSLESEKTYSWDSYSEILEKIIKNNARDKVKEIISNDSIKLNKDRIDNINNLFKKDILDDIKLLPENITTSSNSDI